MHKGGGQAVTRADGKSRLDMLDWQAEAASRSGLQAPPILSGETSSSERRSLNPLFVEYLMRWPIGWSDCACSETALTLWLPLMRGVVSTLLTEAARPPDQGQLL